MADINKIKILNSSGNYDEYNIGDKTAFVDYDTFCNYTTEKKDDGTTYYIYDAVAAFPAEVVDYTPSAESGLTSTTVQDSLDELGTLINNLILDKLYPIGAIYMSMSSENPKNTLGGTWEQIKDTFLLSAGDSYTVGNTGGSANSIIPYHNHSFTGSTVTSEGPSAASTGGPSTNTSGGPSNNTSGGPSTNSTSSAGAHSHGLPMQISRDSSYKASRGLSGWSDTVWFNDVGRTDTMSNHTHDLQSHTHSLQSHTHDLQSHTHSLQSHTHSVTASGSIGYVGTSGNITGANMPPYLVVYMWKRIA